MMIRRKSSSAVLAMALAIVATVAASCSRSTVYSHFEPIPQEGWERAKTLSFAVGPLADSVGCQEVLGLRVTSFYPYTDIVLIISQQALLSGLRCTDTVALPLVNEHGQSLGTGIGSQQFTLPLRQMHLKADDILHVQVRHNMHRDPLPGVSDVGIILSEE
ncbi:MAG: gliding motility lipoprotein GldH [Prevotella sp.]|nr:gliding motility lipoprotein GldH [Prevotella sp.]